MTKVCAVVVVLALGGLAAYAVFAGPTTVPIKTPAPSSTKSAPQAPQSEPEGEGQTGD